MRITFDDDKRAVGLSLPEVAIQVLSANLQTKMEERMLLVLSSRERKKKNDSWCVWDCVYGGRLRKGWRMNDSCVQDFVYVERLRKGWGEHGSCIRDCFYSGHVGHKAQVFSANLQFKDGRAYVSCVLVNSGQEGGGKNDSCVRDIWGTRGAK